MTPWIMLLVLFVARTAMAFQYQAVAALGPEMIDSLLLGVAEIGLLIGLYLGPGIVVAFFGGSLASLLGDRRVGILSLALMAMGGALMIGASSVSMLTWGRVLSGIGGVIVNVVMTKMVVDWFARRDLATALAVFISSWPVGIGLALLLLPWIAGVGGLDAAWSAVVGLAGVALAGFALLYRPPPDAASHGRITLTGLPWRPLVWAALIWGFYNAAIAMVFGFGPILLVADGLSAAQASTATALFIFAIAIANPIGGRIADATGRRDAVILLTLVAGVVLLPAMTVLPASLAMGAYAVAGCVIGLSPGAIVSMTGQILTPETRAFGTGVYYSVYYAVMLVAPTLAGTVAERGLVPGAPFLLAALMMGVCILALAGFRGAVGRQRGGERAGSD